MITGDLVNVICQQNKYIHDFKQEKSNDISLCIFGLQVMHTMCSDFCYVNFPTLFCMDLTFVIQSHYSETRL